MKKQKILTRKNKLRMCRFTAVIISLSLLLQTVAFADDIVPAQSAETAAEISAQQTEVSADETELSDMALVCEDESLRGESEKHFLCEDGSYVAVSYGSPVHYQDEDGNWQEIDNTLSQTVINGITAYSNRDGLFDVEFSADGEKLVTMEKDGYSVSWSVTAKTDAELIAEKILDNAIPQAFLAEIVDTFETETAGGNPVGQIETAAVIIEDTETAVLPTQRDIEINNVISRYNLSDKVFEIQPKNTEIKEKNTDDWTDTEKLISALKSSSEIAFESAFEEDIDLEYVVTPTEVKENIILNSASDITSYVTTLTAEGLTASLKDDDSIELCNAEGEIIFTIAAPYMFDSAGNESYDFDVTFESDLLGNYVITYTPSLEWLSSPDRVYPVTVDPTASITSNSSYIIDTYVVEGETTNTHYTSSDLYVGLMEDTGAELATYLRFSTYAFPTLPIGAEIDDSRINIFLDYAQVTPGYNINAYHVNSSWNQTTVTYTTSLSTSLIQSNIPMSTNTAGKRYYSIPYKSYVTDGYAYYWRTGSLPTDYGVKLTTTRTTAGNKDILCSIEDPNSAYWPSLWVRYETPTVANIEDGIYYINNVNANKPLSIAYNATGSSTQAGIYTNYYHACQRWILEEQSNGYYTIESVNSNDYYLTLSSNSTVASNGSLVYARYLEDSLPTNAYWKIFVNDDGTYRIANKSYIYRVLDCLDGGTNNNTPVQTYVYEEPGNNNQKWNLYEEAILSTPQIGQETDMWCWAASSLMSAKTYNSSISKSQTEIVMHIKGRLTNEDGNYEGATKEEVYQAANFSLDVSNYNLSASVLSESQLKYLLHNGNPVIIGREKYSTYGFTGDGHESIIYGFRETPNGTIFFIRDPWPVQSSPWPSNNIGQSYTRTYEEIVDGGYSDIDNYMWTHSIFRS